MAQVISIIGTGFIAQGLISLIDEGDIYTLGKILTRTDISKRSGVPRNDLLTNNLNDLISISDLIVECSGDAIYATDSIDEILKHDIPVVTMNAEFHVTTGSYFIDKGLVSEAEGDQPGSQAALKEDVIAMGFKPLVYSNIKGFLNHNPSEKDMKYWGNKSGISLDMVTSFTDGTKVQIEQVLVANGLGADIICEGLLGPENDSMNDGGAILADEATKMDTPVSDYVLSGKLPPGVFIVAEHNASQNKSLRYYKMGDGPYYVLDRPFHLCHLEILKTIKRVLEEKRILLDNGENPKYSLATIAKRDLEIGETIVKGIGSFDVRGIAISIKNHPNHVPIGLMSNVRIKKPVKAGEMIMFSDVELADSLALDIWKQMHQA